jgi:hypothetical protein
MFPNATDDGLEGPELPLRASNGDHDPLMQCHSQRHEPQVLECSLTTQVYVLWDGGWGDSGRSQRTCTATVPTVHSA